MSNSVTQVQKQDSKTEASKPSPWVAVVYSPQKEVGHTNQLNQMLGGANNLPLPCHPLYIGLPVEKTGNRQEGIAQAYESRPILLRPGTNLGIDGADWENAAANQFIAPKIKAGIIQVFLPTSFDKVKEPGYRCFESDIAKQLISVTLHEDWIDQWMAGESRAEIIEAANDQKVELIRVKASRAT